MRVGTPRAYVLVVSDSARGTLHVVFRTPCHAPTAESPSSAPDAFIAASFSSLTRRSWCQLRTCYAQEDGRPGTSGSSTGNVTCTVEVDATFDTVMPDQHRALLGLVVGVFSVTTPSTRGTPTQPFSTPRHDRSRLVFQRPAFWRTSWVWGQHIRRRCGDG